MKIIPVLTEKSLGLAKKGEYTFWVERGLTKNQIRQLVNEIFSVHTEKVRTMKFKKGVKKNFRGHKVYIPERKKAVVTLGKEEKIDLFKESSKGGSASGGKGK
jgi:ribosomal protein L23